jgi:uncharacterized cupredoxin-like copper-binding protein
MPIRRWLGALLIGATFVSYAPASASSGVRVVHVRIHYSHFSPSDFAFAPGETVTFVVENTDPIDHEFLLGDESVQLAHELGTEAYHPPRPGEMSVPAGTTMRTTYTFGEPGQVLLGCHLPGHYAYGMRGTISVG